MNASKNVGMNVGLNSGKKNTQKGHPGCSSRGFFYANRTKRTPKRGTPDNSSDRVNNQNDNFDRHSMSSKASSPLLALPLISPCLTCNIVTKLANANTVA